MYSRRELGDRIPRVPRNYSGNAFREEAPPAPIEPPVPIEDRKATEEAVEEAPALAASAAPVGRFEAGKLFGQGGIGSEELLLLGLIFLLSQSNERDDLLLWLILLLFIR